MKKIILKQVEDKLPAAVTLSEAYPNPSNNEATIRFSVPVKQNIKLELFNELGASLRIFEVREFQANYHSSQELSPILIPYRKNKTVFET